MKLRIFAIALFALLSLSPVSPAAGQVTTATFYGAVTDSSQALLPGVNVTMTHEATAVATSKVTDEKGELLHYKVKDPSMHNWLALAMAVRNNEISDFPICNKSFDLSYCGHDL